MGRFLSPFSNHPSISTSILTGLALTPRPATPPTLGSSANSAHDLSDTPTNGAFDPNPNPARAVAPIDTNELSGSA